LDTAAINIHPTSGLVDATQHAPLQISHYTHMHALTNHHAPLQRPPDPIQTQWFDRLGGFEREENIPLFVEWCVKAVELFGRRIHFWATFNEPTVGLRWGRLFFEAVGGWCLWLVSCRSCLPQQSTELETSTTAPPQCAMFLGWITGMHPPGKFLSCITAGYVSNSQPLAPNRPRSISAQPPSQRKTTQLQLDTAAATSAATEPTGPTADPNTKLTPGALQQAQGPRGGLQSHQGLPRRPPPVGRAGPPPHHVFGHWAQAAEGARAVSGAVRGWLFWGDWGGRRKGGGGFWGVED
jgi:hypothetical protein